MNNIQDAYLKLNSAYLTELDWFNLSTYFRFDPRLFEAALSKFSETFSALNPIILNQYFQQSKNPALLGVIADMVSLINRTPRYKTFQKMLLVEIKKASLQVFYIQLHTLKPKLHVQIIQQSNKIFKKWGFAEVDLPINKVFLIKNRTSINKNQRQEILLNLIKSNTRIRNIDYINEVTSKGYIISKRVAELDLKFSKKLKAIDNTKGRYYIVKK